MSNIHANLINNATNMQSQLLEFSHQLSNLSLKSLEDQASFKMTAAPEFSISGANTAVTITLNSKTMSVTIPSNGIPGAATDTPPNTSSIAQKSVAQAMAVVAMNLKGVGLSNANIKSIFEQGITPTSLAAVESQLKGHHDAVLQLALESLSRVTSVLSKIAQKLSQ